MREDTDGFQGFQWTSLKFDILSHGVPKANEISVKHSGVDKSGILYLALY
jgi:hypothetical protein